MTKKIADILAVIIAISVIGYFTVGFIIYLLPYLILPAIGIVGICLLLKAILKDKF
jgi:hypothetical protein